MSSSNMSSYCCLNFFMFLLAGFIFNIVNGTTVVNGPNNIILPNNQLDCHAIDRRLLQMKSVEENEAILTRVIIIHHRFNPMIIKGDRTQWVVHNPPVMKPNQNLPNQSQNSGTATGSELEQQPIPQSHNVIKEEPSTTMNNSKNNHDVIKEEPSTTMNNSKNNHDVIKEEPSTTTINSHDNHHVIKEVPSTTMNNSKNNHHVIKEVPSTTMNNSKNNHHVVKEVPSTTMNNSPDNHYLIKEVPSTITNNCPDFNELIKEVPFTMDIWKKVFVASFKLYIHNVLEDKRVVKEVFDGLERIIDTEAGIKDKQLKEALIDFFRAAIFMYLNVPDTSGFKEFNIDVLQFADEKEQSYEKYSIDTVKIINENTIFSKEQKHIVIYCKPKKIDVNETFIKVPWYIVSKFMQANHISREDVAYPLPVAKKGYYCQDLENDAPRFKSFELVKIIINFYDYNLLYQLGEKFIYFQTYYNFTRTKIEDLHRIRIFIKDA
ncbi:uncharacterized protein LOC142332144 [Lycorma delicatula]|uniref:uncharacterized protein LOC142332144 n=1 Tax=Lycorma delicatula TaxID=130591 RepID=UPI003F50DDDD